MGMLNNHVVVITGGAGLIGQEFIRAVANQSGVAIIADINSELGNFVKMNLRKELKTEKIDFVQMDITSKESVLNSIKYIDEKYGKIDSLVNNAYPRNKNYGKHFFDVEYDDIVENVGMNLGGCIIPSQLFALYFQKQGYGNIINISSIYGVIAPTFELYNNTTMTTPVEYVAAKSGMLHLTKYMAKYFKGMNIRVNSISPGGILDSQPEEFLKKYNQKCLTKGMLDGCDLTGTLIFLLSDMSMYINGQNVVVDDGFTI